MEKGKSKGRARGRARGTTSLEPPGSVQGAQGLPTTSGQQPSSRAHRRGNERPGGLQSRQIGAAALPGAMAALRLGSSTSGDGDNGNGNGQPVGRGTTRGRREVAKILWTKPETVISKNGSHGQAIQLFANYFGLKKVKDWKLCLYHVDFLPEEERTRERKKLLRQHQTFLGDGYLFDGMQLYLNRLIGKKDKPTELVSRDEQTQAVFQIKIRFIKELEGNDIQFLQLMNIILRRCQDHIGLKLLGRNYYNSANATQDPTYNITIWPGVSTSIRQFDEGIMLNVDVTHKFLRNETALDAINRARGQIDRAQGAVVGTIVMTRYNDKTYRVDDIDFNMNPKSTFAYRGENISYMDYYQQKYNVKITNLQQPMLMSRPKKRDIRRGMTGNIYLVPELCTLTGLSDEMKNDFNVMKALAMYMRMTPDRRVNALKTFNMDLARNQRVRQELSQWGLQLEPQMVRLNGRQIPRETISQGGVLLNYQQHTADWSREMRNMKLNVPMKMENWAVVFPSRAQQEANSLIESLQITGRQMGMTITRPTMISLNRDQTTDYIRNLNACAGKQIIVIVLMNNKGDRYGAVKKHLSVTMAIPSQCVLMRTLSKPQRLMSIATKIVIQMNCKLGGEVWDAQSPLKNVMIIGYDTYHDTQKRGDSFGAVVSSLNNTWTKYFGQVARHSNNEELTDRFGAAVKNSLEQYVDKNGMLPDKVIVFRDGVGDGQIGYVKEHEVAAIQKCFERVNKRDMRFGFVIVSKRINTRLFVEQGKFISNPPPGTVVDSVITLPERYDFFLVPQSVNQGTITPTSFNVIHDTSGLKPDIMQRLAFKLTHLYYNWQGSVRVPAPCLYAHKLAYITGTAIHELPHRSMADKLWYL